MTSMADVAKALAVCRFDPNADRKYDGMSGGFYWSDEIPEGTPTRIIWRLRTVLGHRASITLSDPSRSYKDDWDRLAELCPSWPGFRPERSSLALEEELSRAGEDFMKSVEEADRACTSEDDS